MQKRELSEIELKECADLRQIYENKKKDLGLTQNKIAGALEMTQSAVSHYLNGTNALNVAVASDFARLLKVPVSDFSSRLSREISEIASSNHAETIGLFPHDIPEEDQVRFPRLNVEASCGAWLPNDHHVEVLDYVTVARSWAKDKLGGNLGHIQVITARGKSMYPTIDEGDVIFVDTSVQTFEGDGLYLLWYNIDGLKAKRIQSSITGGLIIISDNETYKTETVSGEMLNELQIRGRIRGAWHLSQF